MKLLMMSLMLFSTSAFANDLIGKTTIERILLQNQRGEEVEAHVCCSWVDSGPCMPKCLIQDDRIMSLPPEGLGEFKMPQAQ